MEKLLLDPQEHKKVEAWMEDKGWTVREDYRQDEEYMRCVWDILAHPVFQSMDRYFQHGNTTCKEHCIRVSYMSYKICRKKGWNYREAARAALLHDLFLYDWHTHARETGNHFHGFTHPRVAMNNAVRYFSLTDREKDIILRHMWPLTPVPPKYREGFTIVYADKYCGLAEVGLRMKKWFAISLRPGWARR